MEPISDCQGLKNALPQLEKELEELEKAKNEGMETGEFYDFDRKAENFQDHIKTLIQQYKKLATQEINGFLEQRDNKDEPCTFDFDDDFRVVIKGNLYFRSHQILPRFPQIIKTINGYLSAHNTPTLNLPQLKEIGGSLYAYNVETLNLPQLEKVGDYLYTPKARTFNLPQLKEVCGYLYAPKAKTLNLPQLEKVGDLSVPKAKIINLPQLKEVGGSLSVPKAETLELPQIVLIKGDLYIPKPKKRIYIFKKRKLKERKDLIKQAEDWKNEGILQGKIKRV